MPKTASPKKNSKSAPAIAGLGLLVLILLAVLGGYFLAQHTQRKTPEILPSSPDITANQEQSIRFSNDDPTENIEETSTNPSGNTVTKTWPEYEISLQYPDTWENKTDELDKRQIPEPWLYLSAVKSEADNQDDSYGIFNLSFLPNTNQESLTEIMETQFSAIARDLDSHPSIIAGREALVYSLDSGEGFREFIIFEGLTSRSTKRGGVGLIQISASGKSKAALAQELQAIVASITASKE